MKLLLDTHCWLWWLVEPEKLSKTAIDAIKSLENELWFSVASIWEIAIKFNSGKLPLPQPPEILIPQQMQIDQLSTLSITKGLIKTYYLLLIINPLIDGGFFPIQKQTYSYQ